MVNRRPGDKPHPDIEKYPEPFRPYVVAATRMLATIDEVRATAAQVGLARSFRELSERLEEATRECVDALNGTIAGGFWLRASVEKRAAWLEEGVQLFRGRIAEDIDAALETSNLHPPNDDDLEQVHEALHAQLVEGAKAFLGTLLSAPNIASGLT